ncbi:SUMF1/EgtB/PvdO family nonheme iron enzyme [Desulfobacterales bacterium HSG17]|nr:SUMF1/EgtB/PvdO family nonheme iron enzyme [Desulfobacterales bacterium HSG17]
MKEKKYAVLIASSRFPDEPELNDLQFPENDVDGLNEILLSKYRGSFTNTFVIKNSHHHAALLQTHQVLRDAGQNDLVLIYYSGYGRLNSQGHLCLAMTNTVSSLIETTSIPIETIINLMDASASDKKILILDCYYTGSAGDSFTRSGVNTQLQLMSKGRGTYIVTSSSKYEPEQENLPDYQGVFARNMIEGIRSGKADLDNDGIITMEELYKYIKYRIFEDTGPKPILWSLKMEGLLHIAHIGRTPAEDRRKQIRRIILDLAHKEMIPDIVLFKALSVVGLKVNEMSDVQVLYNELLDQLLDERLKAEDFILQWEQLSVENEGNVSECIDIQTGNIKSKEIKTGNIKTGNIKNGNKSAVLASNNIQVMETKAAEKIYRENIYQDNIKIMENQPSMNDSLNGDIQHLKITDLHEKEYNNSISMKFVYISPGTFMMGSPKNETGRFENEVLHKVTLTKGYYMQISPVTLKQWRIFVNETKYKTEAEIDMNSFGLTGTGWNKKERIYWDNPGFDQTDNHPATCISWSDIEEFLEWIIKKEGEEYRLPTEAEWEYACRAGTKSAYSWGDLLDCSRANFGNGFSSECKDMNPGKTSESCSFPPNEWGLYDMHGNVWEWCVDWYGEYSQGDIIDPKGAEGSSFRVIRGGSWFNHARICRSACRGRLEPSYRHLGFRVVKSL